MMRIRTNGGFRPAGRRVPTGAAGGLTLIELLVATGILAMVILVASRLLAQSHATIRTSQATIRSNAELRAAMNRIQMDIGTMTRDGFLIICSPVRAVSGLPYTTHHLIFTSVGRFTSMVDGATANAARIELGITRPGGNASGYLWRRAILLDPTSAVIQAGDREKVGVSYYLGSPIGSPIGLSTRRRLNGALIGDYKLVSPDDADQAIGPFPCMTRQPSITVPPLTLGDVVDNWPLMMTGVGALTIHWTDGARDDSGVLRWYNKDSPRDGDWAKKTAWTVEDEAAATFMADLPEYNMQIDPIYRRQLAGPSYCAMWTCKRKDNWPKAVRVRLELAEPPRSAEVVVALPR